jgi:hypothetical protein
MARFEIPDGWTVQAFQFALDCTPEQAACARATSRPLRVIAPSAQSGPRSSAEPTVRPGPSGQVAMKRGRDPANRLRNNPETGCQ